MGVGRVGVGGMVENLVVKSVAKVVTAQSDPSRVCIQKRYSMKFTLMCIGKVYHK